MSFNGQRVTAIDKDFFVTKRQKYESFPGTGQSRVQVLVLCGQMYKRFPGGFASEGTKIILGGAKFSVGGWVEAYDSDKIYHEMSLF